MIYVLSTAKYITTLWEIMLLTPIYWIFIVQATRGIVMSIAASSQSDHLAHVVISIYFSLHNIYCLWASLDKFKLHLYTDHEDHMNIAPHAKQIHWPFLVVKSMAQFYVTKIIPMGIYQSYSDSSIIDKIYK